MVGTIEELYFDWLCEKVLSPRSPNYHDLLLVLHRTEFVWVILGDKNRAEYGIDLRHDFLRETHYMSESEWFDNPCSVLEMLVALAGMAQFETDIPTKKWFWIFMENLGLSDYKHICESDVPHIQERLNTFIWRTYNKNGSDGGLFPMHRSNLDQRRVEIWYQFCEYVQEKQLI